MKIRAVLATCLIGLTVTVQADWFGTGPNQFEIQFSGISPFYFQSDIPTGYGAVNYQYRIGKYELLSSSWNSFAAQAATFSGSWQAPGSHSVVSRVSYGQAAMFCNWLTSGTLTNGAYDLTLSLTEGVLDPVVTVNTLTPHQGSAMDALVASFGTVYVLPTENEWYKAAYMNTANGIYSDFANGSDVSAGAGANFNALLSWPSGYGAVAEQNGTYDMMGNLWEMTEEEVIRGGYYAFDEGSGSSLVRNGNRILDDQNNDITLRVVAIPEPSVLSLMGLFGILLYAGRATRLTHGS